MFDSEFIKKCKYNPKTGLFLIDGEPIKRLTTNGYYAIYYKGKNIRVHKLIWFLQTGHYPDYPKEEIDHINGCKLDNSWSNLRLVDRSCNMRNRFGKIGTSKFRGVCIDKYTSKYIVQFRNLEGKKICLKSFDSDKEAALCWDYVQRQMGLLPESSLNFPKIKDYILWDGAVEYIQSRLNNSNIPK